MHFRKKDEIRIQDVNLDREPQSPIDLAREIMGERNVFSSEDAEHYWGITLSSEERNALLTIPFSKAELEECKDTHILTAVLPLSILQMDERNKELIKEGKLPPGTELLYDASKSSWYHNEPFAKERGTAHWALIRKTIVPDSTSKTYEEQLGLLAGEEDVPSTQALIYAILSHFLETGERLFPSFSVHTHNLALRRLPVYVGHFPAGGLFVYDYADSARYGDMGLASARKPTGGKLETPIAPTIPPVPVVRNF